jgi:hypothetical protein
MFMAGSQVSFHFGNAEQRRAHTIDNRDLAGIAGQASFRMKAVVPLTDRANDRSAH